MKKVHCLLIIFLIGVFILSGCALLKSDPVQKNGKNTKKSNIHLTLEELLSYTTDIVVG